MSKSSLNPLSRILITDPPSTIQKKIFSALTDGKNAVSYNPIRRPGVSNLLTILSHFDTERRSPEELGQVHARLGLKAFKTLVADAIVEGLEPVRRRYEEVVAEGGGFLDEVEKRGARVARENAEETMVLVREAVGL
jgi:tryptophanyl-tRNA synthetase